MNIKKDSLVTRSAVFNIDFHLGVIAVQVVTWTAFINQAEVKLSNNLIDREEFNSISKDATEYLQSAHDYCKDHNLNWGVITLMTEHDLSSYIQED